MKPVFTIFIAFLFLKTYSQPEFDIFRNSIYTFKVELVELDQPSFILNISDKSNTKELKFRVIESNYRTSIYYIYIYKDLLPPIKKNTKSPFTIKGFVKKDEIFSDNYYRDKTPKKYFLIPLNL